MKAILIIQFNCSELLDTQLRLLAKYMPEDARIVVFDNSNEPWHKYSNCHYALKQGVNYITCDTESDDFSTSHAEALNSAYAQYIGCDFILFLDHDIFPISPFALSLSPGKIAGAVPQERIKGVYYWPGLFYLNNKELSNNQKQNINFLPNPSLGLDTGGQLINTIPNERVDFFHETHVEHPLLSEYEDDLKSYSLIKTGINSGWIHFRKASNWNKSPHGQERTQRCLQILNQIS